MNKYSKRALKTTATVGMSLAMVLSGVAAPVSAYKADSFACYGANIDVAKAIIAGMKQDLVTASNKKISELAIDDGTTVTWTKTLLAAGVPAVGQTAAVPVVLGDNKLATLLGATVTNPAAVGTVTIADLLGEYVNCISSPDALAKTLAGVKDEATATDTITEKVAKLETALVDLNSKTALFTNTLLTEGNYTILKPVYETISAFYGDFKGNLTSTSATTNKGFYDTHFNNLEAAIEEYEGSYIGDISDDFVAELKDEPIGDTGVTVNQLVNGNDPFNYSKLEKLENFIKDLKEDKINLGAGIAKYSKVSGEDDVIELVDGLEAVVEDLKEVKELLKSTSATVKAYKALNSKMNTLERATNAYVAATNSTVLAYRTALAAFTDANTEALTTYVDDVVSNFFTVEAVLRTSGNYTLRFKDADFARYVDEDEVINASLKTILTTNLVKDEETSVYDSFAGNVDEAEKLMAKVAAVEKIRVNTSFTSAEADIILAARKALNELNVTDRTATDYNAYGLSAKEIRTVKSNADLIGALYAKLILTGTITESGWIDKGAGNWDYINADGSKSTKWVAAGKDWYFVQNGTMLRSAWVAQDSTGAKWYYVDNAGKMVSNTTIDGFVIDANGVWTK